MSEDWENNFKKEMDHLVDMFHTQNNKIGEHSTQIGEMKDWERYLAKGGLLEQIMERVEKLELVIQTILVKYSESEDSTIHKSFYLRLLKKLGVNIYCKYLSKANSCLKMAPCDETYDVLSKCPAVTYVTDKKTYERLKGEKPG